MQWRHASEELVADLSRETNTGAFTRLRPAIDDTHIEGEDTAALNFSRTKNMAALSMDELAHLAAKVELSEKLVLDTAHKTVERFRAVWDAEKGHLPMAAKVRNMIDGHAASTELYREPA